MFSGGSLRQDIREMRSEGREQHRLMNEKLDRIAEAYRSADQVLASGIQDALKEVRNGDNALHTRINQLSGRFYAFVLSVGGTAILILLSIISYLYTHQGPRWPSTT